MTAAVLAADTRQKSTPISLQSFMLSFGGSQISKSKGNLWDERLISILTAMKSGKKMPLISLYQIKDDLYIVDGHHRFKAAKELGLTDIEANIVELVVHRLTDSQE